MMKKILSIFLTLSVIINSTLFLSAQAKTVVREWKSKGTQYIEFSDGTIKGRGGENTSPNKYEVGEIISITDVKVPLEECELYYTCSFLVPLKEAYKGTPIYDLSDNGNLKVTFYYYREGYSPTPGGRYFCFGDSDAMYESQTAFGAGGNHQVFLDGHTIENDKKIHIEVASSDYWPYFKFFYNADGDKEIWFYQYNQWYETSGEIIKVDMNTFTEFIPDSNLPNRTLEIAAANSCWAESAEYAPGILSSFDPLNPNPEPPEEKILDPDEVDYSDLSTDPRRWEDKEKSIEAYGRYLDDEGVFHTVRKFKGDYLGANRDYNVNITAEFEARIPALKLSGNGKVKGTYYNAEIFWDGKKREDIQFIKFEGKNGTKWFMSGDLEVLRTAEDADSVLENDASISLGFIQVESFDGVTLEHISGAKEELYLTFNYSDETKTILNSVTVDRKGEKTELSLGEIDYKGNFASYFLSYVYPDNFKEIAKEMGLSL